MNLDLKLFVLLFMSMGIDWMVQTNWEATNKFTNWSARLRHATVYSALTSFILLIPFGYRTTGAYNGYWIFLTLLITHFIIDKRSIVTWWMLHIKCIPRENMPQLGWLSIGIDFWMHMWVNFIICVVVGYIK